MLRDVGPIGRTGLQGGAHPSHECDAEYLYVLRGGLRSPGCLGYCASLGGSSVTLALTAHAAHPGGLNPKHFDDVLIPAELKEGSTLSFSDQTGLTLMVPSPV